MADGKRVMPLPFDQMELAVGEIFALTTPRAANGSSDLSCRAKDAPGPVFPKAGIPTAGRKSPRRRATHRMRLATPDAGSRNTLQRP